MKLNKDVRLGTCWRRNATRIIKRSMFPLALKWEQTDSGKLVIVCRSAAEALKELKEVKKTGLFEDFSLTICPEVTVHELAV